MDIGLTLSKQKAVFAFQCSKLVTLAAKLQLTTLSVCTVAMEKPISVISIHTVFSTLSDDTWS